MNDRQFIDYYGIDILYLEIVDSVPAAVELNRDSHEGRRFHGVVAAEVKVDPLLLPIPRPERVVLFVQHHL